MSPRERGQHGRLRSVLATVAVATVVVAGAALVPGLPSVSGGEPTSCPVATSNVPDGPDAFGGCYPGPDTTGPDAASDWPGSFTAQGQAGCELPIQSDTTYNFCDFAGLAVGSSGSPVSNVTFHGCRFKTTAVEDANVVLFGADGGTGITFEYAEFAPGNAAPPTSYANSYQYGIAGNGEYGSFFGKLTVDHSDFWGYGNAVTISGSTQSNPAAFTNNYFHDAADDGGSYHTDGIGQLNSGLTDSYVVIDHNVIIAVGNTNGLAFQNGTYDHFTVTHNLFSGFGFTVAIWADIGSTNITFTDNVYSTILLPFFGPLYPQAFWTTTGSTWSGNKWEVPSGAEWGTPAYDGLFWIPDSSSIDTDPTKDDTPFVSATDYSG